MLGSPRQELCQVLPRHVHSYVGTARGPAQPRNIHYIFDIKVDRRPTNENFRDMQLGQSKQQILFARDLKTSQEWPVILNLARYLVKLVGLAPPF